MAYQNQFRQSNNCPPGTGSVGRRGYNNGSRGKKNGYKSNSHRDGSSNYSGFNNHNWRGTSYGSQNYGPRAVPNAPPQGSSATWGAQYGSGYPMPHANPGSFVAPTPVAPALAVPTPNTNAVATSFSNPHVVIAPTTIAPIATPIVTSTQTIAMSSHQSTPSTNIEMSDELKDPPRTKTTSEARDTPRADLANDAFPKDAKQIGSQTQLCSFTPVSADVLKQQGRPTRMMHRSGLHDCAPKEGMTLPIDQLHQKTQDRFEGINQAALTSLPSLGKSAAEKLQLTLTNAREAHEAQETAGQAERSRILSKLQHARESEVRNEARIYNLHAVFTQKMTQASKAVGIAKSTAQSEAIPYLTSASDASARAAEMRQVIEECRGNLLRLDNVRVISANAYAENVQEVMAEVLKSLVNDQSSSPKSASAETEEAQPQTKPTLAKSSHDQESLSITAQQFSLQSAIERRSDQAQQSIEDIPDRVKESEALVGLRQSTNGDVADVTEERMSSSLLEVSGAPESKTGSMAAKEVETGLPAGQKTTSNTTQKSQSKASHKLESNTREKTPSNTGHKSKANGSRKSQINTTQKPKSHVRQQSQSTTPQNPKPNATQKPKSSTPQKVPEGSKPVVPKTEPAVPKSESAIPKPKAAVPKTDPIVFKTEPAVPKTEPIVSKTEPAVLKAKPDDPTAEPDVPKAKPVVPKAKPVVSKTEPVKPKTLPIKESKPVVNHPRKMSQETRNYLQEAIAKAAYEYNALAIHMKDELETHLNEDPEYSMGQIERGEYENWVAKMCDVEMSDPLLATALHAVRDELVALVACNDLRAEKKAKKGVTVSVKAVEEDEPAADKAKNEESVSVDAVAEDHSTVVAQQPSADPATGILSKNKAKNVRKKLKKQLASSDDKIVGGSNSGDNDKPNAGNASAGNEIRKGG